MSQVNKPVYWVEGEEDDPELGYISLQIDEDEGTAECGCRLVRAEEHTGDPAFFLCGLHSAAPELKRLVSEAFDRFTDNDMQPPNHELRQWLEAAKKLLGKGE